jgi:hypothetical protein
MLRIARPLHQPNDVGHAQIPLKATNLLKLILHATIVGNGLPIASASFARCSSPTP